MSTRDEGEVQRKEWTHMRPSSPMAEHSSIEEEAAPPVRKMILVELPTVPQLPPILVAPRVEVDKPAREDEGSLVTPTTAMLASFLLDLGSMPPWVLSSLLCLPLNSGGRGWMSITQWLRQHSLPR